MSNNFVSKEKLTLILIKPEIYTSLFNSNSWICWDFLMVKLTGMSILHRALNFWEFTLYLLYLFTNRYLAQMKLFSLCSCRNVKNPVFRKCQLKRQNGDTQIYYNILLSSFFSNKSDTYYFYGQYNTYLITLRELQYQWGKSSRTVRALIWRIHFHSSIAAASMTCQRWKCNHLLIWSYSI